MRCVNMKWISWVLPKIQSRHNSVHRWTRWNQYYPLQLRWAGGNKTVLVSTLEYLKVPGQNAFTKPACINTMIYRICYQIFVTYVISNTVWNKVRHPPWLVRSVAKDHTMNASYTRWMCLRRRLMPLAHRKLQLDWTPLDYLGAVSIRKTVLRGITIPMLKIRRPDGRLIFNMEIAIRR